MRNTGSNPKVPAGVPAKTTQANFRPLLPHNAYPFQYFVKEWIRHCIKYSETQL